MWKKIWAKLTVISSKQTTLTHVCCNIFWMHSTEIISSKSSSTYFTLIKGLNVNSSAKVDGMVGSPLLHFSYRKTNGCKDVCIFNAASGWSPDWMWHVSQVPLPMLASPEWLRCLVPHEVQISDYWRCTHDRSKHA